MNPIERQLRINIAKRQSYIRETQLVVEDEKSREYFRFLDGRIIEFDLTKSSGLPVRLKDEDLEGDEAFEYAAL